MSHRTRKLIGTLAMFAFVLVYAPIAMALAESRIVDAPKPVQTIAYLVLGLAWILPLMPLIRWMERPDGDRPKAWCGEVDTGWPKNIMRHKEATARPGLFEQVERWTMKYLLTVAVLLAPLTAAAQAPQAARSAADCEKLRDDLAYNQCLASFGPRRGERSAAGMSADATDEAGAQGARSVRRTRNGRKAAAFDVVSGRDGAASREPARRR
jgi:hypothetical protein